MIAELRYDELTLFTNILAMKKLIFSVLSLLCFVLFYADFTVAQSSGDAYRTEVFTTTAAPEVSISTSGGSIKVIGHNENKVRVEMYVRRGSRYLSTADTDLEDFDITIEMDGNTVTASAKSSSSSSWSFWDLFRGDFGGSGKSISFTVYAPKSALVEGRTSGGSVSAENFNSDISLRTSGGSVTARSITGDVKLRTSGGSIRLSDITGHAAVQTSGGSIRAENIIGLLEARTSGGSLRLSEISGAVDARTSGGTIRAELNQVNGNVNLRTSGGSITIEVPGSSGYDLDLSGNRVNVDLVNFTGSSDRSRVSGSINGGGHDISARTSGGSVNLRFK